MQTNHATRSNDAAGKSSLNIRNWITKGLSWETYIGMCTKNVERMKSIYRKVDVPADIVGAFRAKGPFNIVCIAEDWCPDCVQNVPLIVRLVESLPGTNLSLFFRDRNAELMDHYLTNGKKVVPTAIFFDRDLNELGKWAGPSRKAKAWTVDTLIKGRKIQDIPQDEKDRFGDLYDRKFLDEFFSDSLQEMKAAIGSRRESPESSGRPLTRG